MVIEHINPNRYFIIKDFCSNSMKFNTEVAIERIKKATSSQKAKGFDRYLEISAAPSGHFASSLTSALVSVLEHCGYHSVKHIKGGR